MGGLLSAIWSANVHERPASSPQTVAELRSILNALDSCTFVDRSELSADVWSTSDATTSLAPDLSAISVDGSPLSTDRLQQALQQISKNGDLLQICSDSGYHLLQICVGHNNVDMVSWLLSLNVDVNAGVCSLPLHIACYRGYLQCVQLLLEHGARGDVEVPMCWPGIHCNSCRWRDQSSDHVPLPPLNIQQLPPGGLSDCSRSAVFYAVSGDQVDVLKLLARRESRWLPCFMKQPLLHLACELGSWDCLQYLISERANEINQCVDDYYPIHKAALNHVRFLECLIQAGANTLVRTSAQQLSLLHVVVLVAKKSASDTLLSVEVLLKHGLQQLINSADSLGNTPLHALIVRYALEECRYGYDDHPRPWTQKEAVQLIHVLLENGAGDSINLSENSVVACVLRHVKDWQFRYQLLELFLEKGADPNLAGRDGSLPLMACLVPLINKDPIYRFSGYTKTSFLNCVRVLCEHGADPNCSSRGYLTPLHILVFTASESIALNCPGDKLEAFELILELMAILLRHGLNPNGRFNRCVQHVLLAVVELVGVVRHAADLHHVYTTLLTLLQYGADADVTVSNSAVSGQHHICHSQSSLFLRSTCHSVLYHFVQQLAAREHLLLDPQRSYERIINLLSGCMQHTTLYSCLRVLQTQLCIAPFRASLARMLRRLQTNPRSLKQLCRLVIYTSLRRRPAVFASELPLPPPLQQYLLMIKD